MRTDLPLLTIDLHHQKIRVVTYNKKTTSRALLYSTFTLRHQARCPTSALAAGLRIYVGGVADGGADVDPQDRGANTQGTRDGRLSSGGYPGQDGEPCDVMLSNLLLVHVMLSNQNGRRAGVVGGECGGRGVGQQSRAAGEEGDACAAPRGEGRRLAREVKVVLTPPCIFHL